MIGTGSTDDGAALTGIPVPLRLGPQKLENWRPANYHGVRILITNAARAWRMDHREARYRVF